MSPRRGANSGRRVHAAVPPVPPPADRVKPGLVDTLPGERTPRACQACGTGWDASNPLARWLEHDALDKVPRLPDRPRVVVLCKRCSDRVIDPHPRLYRQLDNGAPFPGCMSVCVACVHRVNGTECDHERSVFNGGAGLAYQWDGEVASAHLNYGGGRGEFKHFFPSAVKACSGRAPVPDGG